MQIAFATSRTCQALDTEIPLLIAAAAARGHRAETVVGRRLEFL